MVAMHLVDFEQAIGCIPKRFGEELPVLSQPSQRETVDEAVAAKEG